MKLCMMSEDYSMGGKDYLIEVCSDILKGYIAEFRKKNPKMDGKVGLSLSGYGTVKRIDGSMCVDDLFINIQAESPKYLKEKIITRDSLQSYLESKPDVVSLFSMEAFGGFQVCLECPKMEAIEDHSKSYDEIVSMMKNQFVTGFNSQGTGSRRGFILADGTFVSTEASNDSSIKYYDKHRKNTPHYVMNKWLTDNGFISMFDGNTADEGSPYLEDKHGAIRVNVTGENYIALNKNAPTAPQYSTIAEILDYVLYKSGDTDGSFSINFPCEDIHARHSGISSTCQNYLARGAKNVPTMKECHDNGIEFHDEEYYIKMIKKYYATGEYPASYESWRRQPLGHLFGLRECYHLGEGVSPHNSLNGALWAKDGELRPDVRQKIEKIVSSFVNMLKENGVSINVMDTLILGSNASYNYNVDSDVDIHIIADTSGIGNDSGVITALYNAYRSLFNGKYTIKLNGFPVELYVEDKDTDAKSNGVYSLSKGWIRHPDRSIIPDKVDISKEFVPWEKRYNEVVKSNDKDAIDRLIDGIYALRSRSMRTGGEYSKGNYVFKEFRRKGFLDKLRKIKTSMENKELSLDETWEYPKEEDEILVKKVLTDSSNPEGSTFAILSAEVSGDKDNQKRTKELEYILKKNNFKYVACAGKYGSETESSFMVINPPSKSVIDGLCCVLGKCQESYIYGTSPSAKSLLTYSAYFHNEDGSYTKSPAGDFHDVTSSSNKSSGFTEVGSLKFCLNDRMFDRKAHITKKTDGTAVKGS